MSNTAPSMVGILIVVGEKMIGWARAPAGAAPVSVRFAEAQINSSGVSTPRSDARAGVTVRCRARWTLLWSFAWRITSKHRDNLSR